MNFRALWEDCFLQIFLPRQEHEDIGFFLPFKNFATNTLVLLLFKNSPPTRKNTMSLPAPISLPQMTKRDYSKKILL